MLEIARTVLREFRSVLQRLLPARWPRERWPLVTLDANHERLLLQVSHGEVTIARSQRGAFARQQLALPGKALEELEGAAGQVQLTVSASGTVTARWGKSASVIQYVDPQGAAAPLLPLPTLVEANPPALLAALHDVMATAAKEQTARFAFDKVQLRRGGEIVGTDSRQLLWHEGFHFPWSSPVLVPAVKVFACPELRSSAPVLIGRTDRHVVIQAGPWTVFLSIDATSRFPDVDSVIPKHWPTTWTLTDQGAAALLRALPAGNTEDPEVHVDLGQRVVVHTTGPTPAKIAVPSGTVRGKPQRFGVHVQYLARALRLGFREFGIVDANTPVLCPAGPRRYLFMPLPATAPAPPQRRLPAPVVSLPSPTLKGGLMLRPNNPPTPNPPTAPHPHADADAPSPLAAIVELQGVLRDAMAKLNELAGTLRHQQRQHKVVQNALGSLRRLRQL